MEGAAISRFGPFPHKQLRKGFMVDSEVLEIYKGVSNRIIELVDGNQGASLPSCPSWSALDLLRHVTAVCQDWSSTDLMVMARIGGHKRVSNVSHR